MRYWLLDVNEQTESFQREYKRRLEKNEKPIPVNTTKGQILIFEPMLFCILTETEILVSNSESSNIETVNGTLAFFPHFFEAYFEGLADFEKTYNFLPEGLLLGNRERTLRIVHELLYHEKLFWYRKKMKHDFRKGWAFVARNYPVLIYENELKFFGYYSGMLAGLELMDARFPKILEGVDVCHFNEHHSNQKESNSAIPLTNENQKPLSLRQLALILYYEEKIVNRNNAPSFLTKGLTSGDALFNKVNAITEKAERTGKFTQRQFSAREKDFEKILNLLTGKAKEKAEFEFLQFKQNNNEYL